MSGSAQARVVVATKRWAALVHRVLSPYRRGIALAIYTATAAASYALAFLLRFELEWPDQLTETFLLTLPVLLVLRIGSDWTFRLTMGRWRYVGVRDVLRLAGATTLGSVLFFGFTQVLPLRPPVPRSVVAIEWVLTTYVTAALWIVYRLTYELFRTRGRDGHDDERRALVVGAGEAGSRLVRDMLRTPTAYTPVGFVDDDSMKWGTTLHGIEVIGSIGDLKRIAIHMDADELIIALPSAEPEDLRRIVDCCAETGLGYKVLPGISEVLSGHVSVQQLRDVKIEDLLGREPVELALPELEEEFSGRVVLITGAAGSIGSELARQVALHDPKKLVLLDRAESDLYFIDLELRREHEDLDVVPVVGDILDQSQVESVFNEHSPERVFHAAAYKHVPLMEEHVREAVLNNVVGTWRVAQAAAECGTGKFVLVSTDKAVRPANVMGATKRVAELLILACESRFPDTAFTAVRFGNVLGSQGSVIPLFKRQLKAGEPLTVTHPDVTRYFMTISEAVQLVLQASVLDQALGRIAMLEMGEPVKIVDLARNLLRLSGRGVNGGKDIRFVGLRPGEKLHEELNAPEEETIGTEVSKIRIVRHQSGAAPASLLERIERWANALSESTEWKNVNEDLWEICGESGVIEAPPPSSHPRRSSRQHVGD